MVEQIDPVTGAHSPLITGLRTAIDVLPLAGDYLVLQHTSGVQIFPPFTPPGLVLNFDTPASSPTVVANCLSRPTSMTFDHKTGLLYVSTFGGSVVEVSGASSSVSNSSSLKWSISLRSILRKIEAGVRAKVMPD